MVEVTTVQAKVCKEAVVCEPNPFEESAQYFPTLLQQTVFFEKYSRWNWSLGRRETWIETVDRSVNFLRELSRNQLDPQDYMFLRQSILNLDAMPSMRLLAMAGEAARRQNVAIYNCSYLPLNDLAAFSEIMLLSMNGTGVGYSVEKHQVAQLPPVVFQTGRHRGTYYIKDSTEGWVDALRELLDALFSGDDIDFSFDFIRPAGAILRTKGGRASGPEPLREAFGKIRKIVLARQGRRLRPIDAHDIACWVASASICGGVRRSALIALFSVDDQEMLTCKQGAFWEHNPQRMYANNSVVVGDSTPEFVIRQLLYRMDENRTGEPGLFNRDGVRAMRPKRRADAEFGINPCGEIVLRAMQVCNLSSAVVRAGDNFEALARKVRAATIIGTIQSMADYFPGFRSDWSRNQREERLLGVDLNGQMDNKFVQNPGVLRDLHSVAIATNEAVAHILGINQSAAVTTVKPSGNSSQLLNTSSGLHARWSPYYIRHVRFNTHSPVRKLLADQGMPMYPENGQTVENAYTWVVPFPMKSPNGAVCRNDRTALEQLDYWLLVRRNWTEHQPSVTITYGPDELEDVITWVLGHKEYIAGLSFLPASDHVYPLAPYVEISEADYEKLMAQTPSIDFSRLPEYEADDYTNASQEISCVGGACELVL